MKCNTLWSSNKLLKNGLLLLLFFSFTVKGFSQDFKKYRFGLHASPSVNWISTDTDGADGTNKIRFGYGLLAEIGLTENYSISTGINIVNKGGELTINDTSGNYVGKYVEIPFTLKMKTNEIGYFTYFARFGLGFAYKTGESVDFDPEFPIEPADGDYINDFSISLMISAGAEYSLGSSASLVFGLTFNNNLTDTLDDIDVRIDGSDNNSFGQLVLDIGILF